MISSISAFLLAHFLADFLFQSNWIAQNKRRFPVLMAHGAIIFLTAVVLSLGNWQVAIIITLTHTIIDAVKCRVPKQNWQLFSIDQAAHIMTIAAVMLFLPFGESICAIPLWLTKIYIILTAIIATTQMGGHLVGLIMAPFDEGRTEEGLQNAGKLIGQLERLLILMLVLVGQSASIGLLIAAKSILRFGVIKDSRPASEYIIIGTLASFTWAIFIAFITSYALDIAQ